MAFVCFSNDYMDRSRRMSLTSNPDEFRKFNQHVDHCLMPIKSWALACGGSIVSDDPCISIYEVSASALADVPKLLQRFKDDSGLFCWVGVGSDMMDCVRAADLAKRKNLNKPYLMREEILDEPETQRQVVKNESDRSLLHSVPSPQEELQKAIPNWLKRAGIVAMLAGGGHPHVLAQPSPQKITISAPKQEEAKKAPVKLAKPLKYKNKRFNDTFLSTHHPLTLANGLNDTLWAIHMIESSGGKDLDHMHQMQRVNHPLTQERITVDNTAFGHLGVRPMTAFDAYLKHVGGAKKYINSIFPPNVPKVEGVITSKPLSNKAKTLAAEKAFMNKFYKDPVFYNEVSQMYLKDLVDKFGKKTSDGHISNPMDVIAAWHYGLYSKDQPKADPHGYKQKAISHINAALKSGKKLDFSDTFGQKGHESIVNTALPLPQSAIAKEK